MIRSLLFLPGNKPNILIHGEELLSDAIIYDLEDSVSLLEKDAARILVSECIKSITTNQQVVVRINSSDSPYMDDDIKKIVPLDPDYILLPKSCNAKMVHEVCDKIRAVKNDTKIRLICLIETAEGVENAYEIATSDKMVSALFLGGEDLTADLGCKRTKQGNEIDYSRKRLVVAAKAAGVECYDTPFTDVNDDEGIIIDAEYAKSLGFNGKSSIAPRHISAINSVFSPKKEEIEYAKAVFDVIAEAKKKGQGVVSLKGKMIDKPVENRAIKTIETAKLLGLLEDSNE